MGMFDDVICRYPLPDGKPAVPFQTKTFEEPYLEKYTITENGRLTKREPWVGNLPADKYREIDTNYHGILNFYGGDADEWREFDAKFTDGQLVSITQRKS